MPAPLPPTRTVGSGSPSADINMVVVAIEEIRASYVALDGGQTITGVKTFDHDVHVGTSSVTLYASGTIETQSAAFGYASLDPSFMYLEAGPATDASQNPAASIGFRSKYWTGSASDLVNASLRFQPNSGDPYFEFNQNLNVGSNKSLGAWVTVNDFDDAYISLYPSGLELAANAATSGNPTQIVSAGFTSRFWNGTASAATSGFLSLQPNSGDPYFEFDQPVQAVASVTVKTFLSDVDQALTAIYPGQIAVQAQPATVGSANEASVIAFYSNYYSASNHQVMGQLALLADNNKPYFYMDKPLQMGGITGATLSTRVVGGTASGAPSSGTFTARDIVVTTDGHIWVCTAAGTPGTWRDLG